MAITTEDALARLGRHCRLLLVHDRPIVRPVDDSVARLDAEGLQVLRRPAAMPRLPIELALAGPTILAVGGHLKNTVALGLALGSRCRWCSARTWATWTACRASRSFAARSTTWSISSRSCRRWWPATCTPTMPRRGMPSSWPRGGSVPLRRVQHHHAHVAACMAEHRLEGPVLGFAWDGTGYGGDGTIWGGEALLCEGAGFVRAAHLRTFALPGGDRAMRRDRGARPWGCSMRFFGRQAAGDGCGRLPPAATIGSAPPS